jgi:stearoyl-CoA desaturase (delta-9 desaturase)
MTRVAGALPSGIARSRAGGRRPRAKSPGERWRNWLFIGALHALPVAAIVGGTTRADWLAFAVLYPASCVGIGMGLHRYFAHRSFRTSRAFQLALAVFAGTAFTDPIGFAGKHRLHHRHSDTPADVHSPGMGFWSCWFGSLVDDGCDETAVRAMTPDLARYPELVWLRRYFWVPGVAVGALTWCLGGFSMFAVAFCGSRVLMLNLASALNYFCHRLGTRRYATPDRSTNNVLVALLTFGEGWHNNHHHYPASARAGFFWWEIDPFYYAIRLLAWLGIVWDVREVPDRVRYAHVD